MDIDALLPGLAKLLEQRLGRTGYYIGNVVALFASAIIILIPLIMVGGALWVVYPELFTRPGEAIIAARQSFIVYGIGAALWVVGVLLLNRMAQARLERKRENAQQELDRIHRYNMRLLKQKIRVFRRGLVAARVQGLVIEVEPEVLDLMAELAEEDSENG